MLLIDQGGKRVRKVCDRCHHQGKIKSGEVCEACREPERIQYADSKAMLQWAKRYQAELALIDTGQVKPLCSACGALGNRPNFASARACGKVYRCESCRSQKVRAAR